MIRALLAALLLSACTTVPPADLCASAAIRRMAYTSVIVTTDAYVASGRPVPPSIALGRQAAVMALAVLDGRCPRTQPSS